MLGTTRLEDNVTSPRCTDMMMMTTYIVALTMKTLSHLYWMADIVENAMLSKVEKQEKQKEEREKHDVDSEDEDGDSADDEDPEATKRYWEMKVAEDIHKASVCLTLGICYVLSCDAFPSQKRKVTPLMT